MHVWLGVTATARDSELWAVLREIEEGLQHLCVVTVQTFAPESDIAQEAVLLRAFTDGLALNAITDIDTFAPECITTMFDIYLERLAASS